MKICLGCMEQYEDEFDMCPHCGYEEGTPPEFGTYMEPGNILNNRYVVGQALGHGGFSVTYIAWDTLLQSKVAVKEYLPSELATRAPGQTQLTVFSGKQGEDFQYGKQRFLEEAKRLAEFDDEPGIVHVFDSFTENETAYLIMEYLEGETLAEYLEQNGTVDPEKAIKMMRPLMSSLQRVHDGGMIHRDISPDNIMLLPDGTLKLIDFGAARHAVADRSKSMTVVIKDGYSPVEQYHSHSIQGPSADVYALAATMYQMMTGVIPPTSTERSRSKKNILVKPDKLNKKITHNQKAALLNALNIQAENRTQTVLDFADQLESNTKIGIVAESSKKRPILDWPLWAKITTGSVAVLLAGAAVLYFVTAPGKEPENTNTVLVPNIINLSTADAQSAVTASELSLKINSSDYDEEVARDHILAQNPTVGTSLEKLSVMNATASLGKELTAMPVEDQTGKIQQDAIDELKEQGIAADNIEIKTEYSDTDMAGTISSQNVPAGEFAELSSKIVLTVSMGRENDTIDREKTVTVSDYTGMDYDDVKADLIASDVYLAKSGTEYNNSIPYGHIIRQYPVAGETVNLGDAVFVVVSLGTEKTPVPNVLYKHRDEAIRMLAENGLGYSVSNVINDIVALDHVVSQAPLDGVVTNFGAEIALDISAENTGKESASGVAVEFDKNELNMKRGESVQLGINISATDLADIVWASSRESVVKVEEGKVTAVKPGTAMITAVAKGSVAKCYITVTDDAEFTVVDSLILDVGDKVNLGSGMDKDILEHIYWISDKPDAATVDGEGVVIAVAEGNTVITAIYEGAAVKCTIKIVDSSRYAKVKRSDIYTLTSDAQKTLNNAGVKYTVTELYNEEHAKGQVYNFKYVGYSDSEYFRIDKTEDAVLYSSLGKATVNQIEIKTKPTKTSYYTGEKLDTDGLSITAVYTDGTRQTVDSGFKVESDFSTPGEKTVTVTYGDKKTTFKVSVKDKIIAVESIRVSPETLSLVRGESQKLSFYITPGNATEQSITLKSSDTSVVQVNGFTVTAAKVGIATVTASSANGKTAVCQITVIAPAVSSVSVSEKNLYLTVGDTCTLSATVSPYDANEKTAMWKSSDTGVVTVDSYGNLKALAAGSAQITASAGSKSDVCNVTVSLPDVSGVTISKTNLYLESGQKQTLTASVSPSNASNKTITWSSDNKKVATVDVNGQITAVASGTAKITAQVGGKQASCTVTVTTPVQSISIESESTIELGRTYTVTPDIKPDNADDCSFTMKTSDTGILSIDGNKFKGLKAGTATLTVTTSNGKSASCKVTVLGEANLTLIEEPSNTTYYIGDLLNTSGLKLGYTDVTGKYSEITSGFKLSGYDMSNSGTQTVKVEYEGMTVKFDITVKTPSITINKSLTQDVLLLAVQTEPENQEFEIRSSDREVFIVASYLGSSYVAQPTGEGTAYAYASMIYNGVEYSDYVAVTVERIVEEYTFEISYTPGDEGISIYTIKTDIPNFDVNGVKWSCTADCDTMVKKNVYVVYDRYDFDFYTVTAYYYYDGIPFEATYTYQCTEGNSNNNNEWADKEIIQPGDICANLYKPVIYLYPEEETEVSVKLDYNGVLTSTYPTYNAGWKITAKPDGTLIDLQTGREYYCLFWEGVTDVRYDFSQGFCVCGEDTAAFLEKSLRKMGLTDKEANEFIIFWMPKMEVNAYNLISFQSEVYTDNAVLTVDPLPDTMIRVFMAWRSIDEPIEIVPQELSTPERKGFTVVEWGGAEVTN